MTGLRRVLTVGFVCVVVGFAAAAYWIYGMGGGNGNTSLASQEAGQCTLDDGKRSELAALSTGALTAFRVLDEPQPLHALGFMDASGKAMTLTEITGKPFLLNLWATWCAPCRKEMPYLAELDAVYEDKGFDVQILNAERDAGGKPEAFLGSIGVDRFDVYRDGDGMAFQYLRGKGLAFGLPTTILVDGTGCAVGVLTGEADWAGEEARALADYSLQAL